MTVAIRALDTLDELRAAQALFQEVWRNPVPQVTAELLRAAEHAGCYVAGAYDGSRLVGASFALLASGPGREVRLHSHITGVLPDARGGNVGWALKLHQRGWSLDRGIEVVTWTFDPLVRRNAWFNVAKLGAVGVGYLVDFYGPMSDGLNAGEPSDRLLVEWHLSSPRVVAAVSGTPVPQPDDGVVVLDEVDAAPVVVGAAPAGGVALVRLPADVESLRATDPAAARRWRVAVRDVLAPLLAGGGEVVAVTRAGDLAVSRRR
ncbi:MAG TPA: hypothetical protein VNA20_10455 [Frankiaceae bacterium]|nr:hypothetical protein [Frankiaceae bacterium]